MNRDKVPKLLVYGYRVERQLSQLQTKSLISASGCHPPNALAAKAGPGEGKSGLEPDLRRRGGQGFGSAGARVAPGPRTKPLRGIGACGCRWALI